MLLLDALPSTEGEGSASAIVIAGLDPWGVGAEAVYAPTGPWTDAPDPAEGKGAQTQDQTLATGPGIEDSSRPPALMVLDHGLAGLLLSKKTD